MILLIFMLINFNFVYFYLLVGKTNLSYHKNGMRKIFAIIVEISKEYPHKINICAY